MISRVLRFVRLPMLVILLYAIGRFYLGASGAAYTPRNNAVFSTLMLTLALCFIWGALSKRVGKFGWKGTIAIGFTIGVWNQLLIFLFTAISYIAGITTYYNNWDNLNIPEGSEISMGDALMRRAVGLIFGAVTGIVITSLGRLFSFLSPAPPRPEGWEPKRKHDDDLD
jgi:hypothetical protein